MKIVDLSLLKKEDIQIKAVTGEEYNIDGNFSTEFYLALYDAYETVQEASAKQDIHKATSLLKDIVLAILRLDPMKQDITLDTLREQKFDSFEVLQAVLAVAMEAANKAITDPNSQSPKSNK